MGRMKKAHKTILDWELSLTYTCPVTGEKVKMGKEIVDDFSSYEQECEICGSHGSITLSVGKCKSCGKYHDSIDIESW